MTFLFGVKDEHFWRCKSSIELLCGVPHLVPCNHSVSLRLGENFSLVNLLKLAINSELPIRNELKINGLEGTIVEFEEKLIPNRKSFYCFGSK